MSAEQSDNYILAQNVRPRLAAKARMQIDQLTGEPVVLYPEGVLLLNATGAEILRLCDGQHTFLAIVRELAHRYNVSPEVLQREVNTYLVRLHKRSLVEFSSEEKT
ncbi:MAG: pyrroloquinoline quinone biosynthesis peptide chaperone PqqD [Chloroflexi bacterium]|nr:pyrroloquinoline quinone biosynthesis peptide chaperone PqqD [Chloroflexota bacterium]